MLDSIEALRSNLKIKRFIKEGGAPKTQNLDWRSVDANTRDERFSDLFSVLTLDHDELVKIITPIIMHEISDRTKGEDVVFKSTLCDPNVFVSIFHVIVKDLMDSADTMKINQKIPTVNVIGDMLNRLKSIVRGSWSNFSPIMVLKGVEGLITDKKSKEDHTKKYANAANKALRELSDILAAFKIGIYDYHMTLANNDGPVQRVNLMKLLKLHPGLRQVSFDPDIIDQSTAPELENQRILVERMLSCWKTLSHDGIFWASLKPSRLKFFLPTSHSDYEEEDDSLFEEVLDVVGINYNGVANFDSIPCNLETAEDFIPLLTDAPSGLFKIHNEMNEEKSTISALRGFSIYFHSYHRWIDFMKELFEAMFKNPDHHLYGETFENIEVMDPMILSQLVFGKYSYDLIWDGSAFTTISRVTMRSMDCVMHDLMLGSLIDATSPTMFQSTTLWSMQELLCPIRRIGKSSALNSLITRLCFQDYRSTGTQMVNHTVEIDGLIKKKILHVKIVQPGVFALSQLGYEPLDSVYDSGVYKSLNNWTTRNFGVFFSSLTNVGCDDFFADFDFNFESLNFVNLVYSLSTEREFRRNKELSKALEIFPKTWFMPLDNFYNLIQVKEHTAIEDRAVQLYANFGFDMGYENREFNTEFKRRLALSKLLTIFTELMNTNSIKLEDNTKALVSEGEYLKFKKDQELSDEITDDDRDDSKKERKSKKENKKKIKELTLEQGFDTTNLMRITSNYAFTQNLLRLKMMANRISEDPDSGEKESHLTKFIELKTLLVQSVMKRDFTVCVQILKSLLLILKEDIVLMRRIPEITIPVTGLIDDFRRDELTLSFKSFK